jgi:AdoMet-dependent rRNA methyltransferase SPB1
MLFWIYVLHLVNIDTIIMVITFESGGWLQVASKYMPVSGRLIVGVDLAPIKPIPNVITLQEDITTAKCKNELKKHFKDRKVDVVLHDGAPNVGTAWAQDAYSQNELVLASLRLGINFLREGGL